MEFIIIYLFRFRAITRPLHQHALSRVSIITIILIIWVFSMVVSLPPTIMSRTQSFHLRNDDNTCSVLVTCTNAHKFYGLIMWIRFCLYFVGPFLVISFCYIAISTSLCKDQRSPTLIDSNVMDSNFALLRRQMDARRKLSVVVLVLVVSFVICRLPYESHAIYIHLTKSSVQSWTSVATILLFLYTFINPLILCILSPTFRRFVIRIWCPCCTDIENPEQNHTVQMNFSQIIQNRVNRKPSPLKIPV